MAATCTSAWCGCDRPRSCIERQPGEYLIAISRLLEDREGRVSTGAVAATLDVRAASVTGMFGTLDEEGMLDYEKHAGVVLTERGASIARELTRRQCVFRSFFAAELDMVLDPPIGYRIGYHLADSSIDRLAELSGSESNVGCSVPVARWEECACRRLANC